MGCLESEVEVYERKIVRKKGRKHIFDQKSKIQEKKERRHAFDQEKKVRNQDLDHAIVQEKKSGFKILFPFFYKFLEHPVDFQCVSSVTKFFSLLLFRGIRESDS